MDRRLILSGIPVLALAGAAAPASAAETPFTIDAAAALAAYQAFVEDYLSGVLGLLRATSVAAEARSGKWETAKPLVEAIAANVRASAAVWYALPDGSYATSDQGPVTQNLRDREYFPGLMAGKTVLGPLVISKSTGHRSIIAAAPVLSAGRTVAALGVSVRARLLSQLVDTQAAVPANMILYALDPTGRTAIHRDPDLMFAFPSDMGDPSLKAAVAKILAEDKGEVSYSYKGVARDAVFARSALTGWTFVLAKLPG